MCFPEKFVWGAASASYQVEGGAFDDDKGLSVWDMMSRWSGKIHEGNKGDVSCDFYHRYQEDVQLMAKIGLKAYRFSISWPRVLPDGVGNVNPKGLDFYDRLVDTLLAQGIQPWITLFHWDFPYSLYCRGGWLNRNSVDWFVEYTEVVVKKLSDRVRHWITQNEIQVFIGEGHAVGIHAPGIMLDIPEILLATHHALLAHGKSVQTIRAHAKLPSIVGAAPVGIVKMPISDGSSDLEAAKKLMFSTHHKHYWLNTWYTDPMILGSYPEDGMKLFGAELPDIQQDDLKTICQPLDFYGANIYHGEWVKSKKDGGYKIVPNPEGYAITTMEWPVVPKALYWGPKFLYERYKLPIVITENGMANCDWEHLDGKVHDPQRIDFLSRYLCEFKKAIDEGVESIGYFLWSIMDNFEWVYGFRQRFGLIYVDYQTKKRILKDSAYWYRDVISSNGKILF